MPRLTGLKHQLPILSPSSRIDQHADYETKRRDEQPWRKWYKLARWRKLRWAQLVADMFTCRMCGRLEGDASKLHCDHVDRHGGDWDKFWRGPFQTLCESCHNSVKQAREREGDSNLYKG